MLRSRLHIWRAIGVLLAAGIALWLVVTHLSRPAQLSPVPPALSGESPTGTPVEPVQHPRIFFSESDIPRLRSQAQTTHREIWAPILSFARSQLNSAPPGPPREGDLDGYRNAGNAVIAFAFAHVITGDPAQLDLARRYLLAFIDWRDWGDERGYGDRDLGFHHMLMGNAIAFDWVYDGLSESDRATIATNLARRAQESYEASSSIEYRWNNWWRRAYTQNHNWTNHSALGMAALVLEGQDPRATEWLRAATEDMERIRYLLEGIADGSWHEGIPYQSYGLTMSLPFWQNLRRLKGMDLIPHTYLRNYVAWRVYNSLPGSGRFALTSSDLEWSWANAYGPEGVLRFAAAEYRDGHAEWMSRQIAGDGARPATVYTAPWYVFEFLYYDPSVVARPPDDLDPSRTFPDLEGVIWRTGWGDGDLVFALKTGAPGGRFAYSRFTNGKQFPFDPRSSVELYHTGHDHDDANGFYLYRGGIDLASETVGYQLTDTYYHNTLLVDGQGQYRTPDSVPELGRDPALLSGTDGGLDDAYGTRDFDFLIADASRRYRYTDPGSGRPGSNMVDEFKRSVLFSKPDYLVMVDNVRAASTHQYDWVSHFGKAVSLEGDWVKGAASGGQLLGIKVLSPSGFATWSGDDGKPFLRIQSPPRVSNVKFVTVLYPTDDSEWQSRPAISSLGDDGRAIGVRVLLNGTNDHLIRYGEPGTAIVGEYSFDGQVASVSKDAGGTVRRVFLGQGGHLADTGGARTLVRAARTPAVIQIDYLDGGLEISGDNLGGVAVYAPGVGVDRVTVNGQSASATRDGDDLLLHP